MSNLSARSGLRCEQLEPRDLFDATAVLAGGVLTVAGTAGADNRLRIGADADLLRVFDGTVEVAAFASASVSSIAVASGGVNDTVIIDDAVTQAATLTGGTGRNKLVGGGGATSSLRDRHAAVTPGDERKQALGRARNDRRDGSRKPAHRFVSTARH